MEENYVIIGIVVLLVWIGVIFLIREVVTWYYKINRIVNLLEKNNDLLQKISLKIKPDEIKNTIDSDLWSCPKCGATNRNETYQCISCGYRLK